MTASGLNASSILAGLKAGRACSRPIASRGKAISLQPQGHAGAEWWHLNLYEDMVAVLDRVKRLYNVDGNLVYLTGISDGATGAYFDVMKLPTPFSAFLPLNGNRRMPATPGTRANGQMYGRRSGNTFTARSRGVAAFTLLLSRDIVNFVAPVVVTRNGERPSKASGACARGPVPRSAGEPGFGRFSSDTRGTMTAPCCTRRNCPCVFADKYCQSI